VLLASIAQMLNSTDRLSAGGSLIGWLHCITDIRDYKALYLEHPL